MTSLTRFWLRTTALVATLVVFLLILEPARADLFFLKDGFVLSGHLTRDTITEIDPADRRPFEVPVGFYRVDDGPRIMTISPRWVGLPVRQDPPTEEKIVDKREFSILEPKSLPPILGVREQPDFDAKWQRTIKLHGDKGDISVPQRLGVLTPYYFRVDAIPPGDRPVGYFWSSAYLTQEMTPDKVRALIASHPEFDEKGKTGAQIAVQRFRCIDFLVQAGWFDDAEAELNRLAKDLPEQKDKVERTLVRLNGYRAADRLERIKRRHLAGQPLTVRSMLKEFPEKDAPDKVMSDVTTLRADYDAVYVKLEATRRYLEELPKELKIDPETLTEAATAIRAEVLAETLNRLEPFLLQAQQAERQRKAGKMPELGARELIALAVTGYLLGSPSADTRYDHAVRLWKARRLVMESQKARDDAARQKLLADYRQDRDGNLPMDEMVQMIPMLPPPEAETNVEDSMETTTREIQVANGPRRNGPTYVVQLPPEYRHSRPYPVLIVLHDAEEKPQKMLKRWAVPAAEHGYIVVAPSWGNGAYGYSETEHAVVTETLRDLRRRFNVDSDRVFLHGLGQGGVMAFDVGMSHPDLFAGVLPMGAAPQYYTERYFRNAQYLPFYVVTGGRMGKDSRKRTSDLMDKWMMVRNFPMLWIEYKGRGTEWFGGELPNMFDWMRPKRRVFPLHECGNGNGNGQFENEFTILRHGDNHFYWLSTDAVNPGNVAPSPPWENKGPITAAILSGEIRPKTNEIIIQYRGLKQLTIWLGRGSRGESMIDFDRPVAITIGFNKLPDRKVEPKLETLLEDLRERGDRQRLFLAKIELKSK
jgi:hypothetical protein